MNADPARRFPIRFDGWYGLLSPLLLLPPSSAEVELADDVVSVRMGWAFSARFPRSAIVAVAPFDRAPISRGVHGFSGRWLVNGSGAGILSLELKPAQRARVLGVPVGLRQLLVSVEDPEGLARALVPSA